MNEIQKAKELVRKFMSIDEDSEQFDGFKMGFFYGQRCALIAVNEILKIEIIKDSIDDYYLRYWQQVKTEIEKL